MKASARSRRERSIDYWPGFVDALSTLVLGIIFLLTVFVVVQFFLSQEVAGKDTALTQLNAQIAQLTDQLSLDKGAKIDMEEELARLRASLSGAETERDRIKASAEAAGAGAASVQAQLAELAGTHRHDEHRSRQRKKHQRTGAGSGRGAQPADRGVAAPIVGSGASPRCGGIKGS